MTFTLLAFVAAVSLAAPGRADADTTEDKKRATTLLQEGVKLLDRKEFAAALERFTDAYRLVASAKIQFNIGLAQEGLNRPADAIRAYRIYLDEAPTDLASRRTDARVRIDALRPHVSQLTVTTDQPGSVVLIDGVEEGRTPLSRSIVVNPGSHRIEVQFAAGGQPWTKSIVGEPGAKLDLRAIPPVLAGAPPPYLTMPDRTAEPVVTPPLQQPSAPPADQPTDAKPIYKRGWFWGAVAAVVVAGTVGALLASRGGDSTTFACDVPPCASAGR